MAHTHPAARPDADPIQHKRLPPAATSRPTRTTTHAHAAQTTRAGGNATQTCMQCMRGSNKTRPKCKIRISSPPISWRRPADHIRAYGIQPTHTLCPARPDADQRNIYAHTFYIYIYTYKRACIEAHVGFSHATAALACRFFLVFPAIKTDNARCSSPWTQIQPAGTDHPARSTCNNVQKNKKRPPMRRGQAAGPD